jgi:hypothetical protein
VPPPGDGATPEDALDVAPPIGPVTVALLATGARCVVAYVIVPGVDRVVASAAVITAPVVIGISLVCIGIAARATLLCASRGRWPAAALTTLVLCMNIVALLGAIAG